MDGQGNDRDANGVSTCWNLSYSVSIPLVLRAAIELNIFGIIADAGPDARLSLSEIISLIPANNSKAQAILDIILRFLATISYLSISSRPSPSSETGQEMTYGLTKESRILIDRGNKAYFSSLVLLGSSREITERFYELKDMVTDHDKKNFGGKDGQDVFKLIERNPEFGKLFNRVMSVTSQHLLNDVIREYQGFGQVIELMDVGGGVGTSLEVIVSAYPHICGINFDLPHVVAQARKCPGIKYVGGDMFGTLPKAQTIWMKWILHDWNDNMCEKILKNCWESLPEDGKVIVVEYIIPEKPGDIHKARDAIFIELQMMVMNLDGKERTRPQFERLAKASGFAATNFIYISNGLCVIEFLKKQMAN